MGEDSIPAPEWLTDLFRGWHDPYPLNGDGPIEPRVLCYLHGTWLDDCVRLDLSGCSARKPVNVWVNPGFSRKEQAIEKAIEWHQRGYKVVCYLPIESSTKAAKRLLQYGCRRLYFERRPYEGCRGIEIVILTGEP